MKGMKMTVEGSKCTDTATARALRALSAISQFDLAGAAMDAIHEKLRDDCWEEFDVLYDRFLIDQLQDRLGPAVESAVAAFENWARSKGQTNVA
jgi:hypothetical protein